MSNIIPETEFNTTVTRFYKKNKISGLLKKCNFTKQQGFSNFVVFKFLFELIFSGKNLYAHFESNSTKKVMKKDTCYRFLSSPKYNWRKLLALLSSKIIETISELTSEDRENVIIIDDSFYDRKRSKKVELSAWVHDHTDSKSKKGFKMLTAVWSDGNTLIPFDFSMMSSSNKTKRIQEATETIDSRCNGAKRRKEATLKSTDVMVDILKRAKKNKIPAKTVLFDSWFSFPKTIINVVNEGFNVICMLKKMKTKYKYNDKDYTLAELYKILKKRPGKAKILASIEVTIHNSDKKIIKCKIVFVRNKNKKKEWLALLSTDVNLDDAEIVRIYGKRWEIEVFFKMTKSYLALAKEFQCRSYDSIIAHTTLVFIRYIMLSLASRESTDDRTIGMLFYLCTDEAKDITFSEAVQLLMNCLINFLKEHLFLSKTIINEFVDGFLASLPMFISNRFVF